MFDALARLANGRARRVGLFAVVFFLLAGAIGGSVADRLDPYGAEDPDTETVKAMDRLEEAGLRVPAVIAVVEDAPVADPATRQRVVALEHQVRERPDVTSVTGYYDTRSPAFVSRDGRLSKADLGDYANSMVKDPLSRLPGVGEVTMFETQYAMRIWLDPHRLNQYGLTPGEVWSAIEAENAQVSAGQLGARPADAGQQFTATVNV